MNGGRRPPQRPTCAELRGGAGPQAAVGTRNTLRTLPHGALTGRALLPQSLQLRCSGQNPRASSGQEQVRGSEEGGVGDSSSGSWLTHLGKYPNSSPLLLPPTSPLRTFALAIPFAQTTLFKNSSSHRSVTMPSPC